MTSGRLLRQPALPASDPAMRRAMDLRGPIVPRQTVRSDRVLPILIVASLAVHATIMLPTLLGFGDHTPAPPHEIPVEVIQLPPKPAEKPKAPEKPKTVEAKAADKPKAEKKLEAKAAPPKPAPKPQRMAQKPPPKPSPQKPSPQKMAAKPPAKPPSPAPLKPTLASTSERMRDLLGPMPAIALPGASAGGTEDVSYSQLVLSQVAKAKKEGRYRGVPGAASVAFTIGDAGDVADVAIVRPSGDQALDDEAIAMVKRGAPYPPPQPGGRRDYTITLRFQPLI